MTKYTLKFDAEFADGDAELAVQVAKLLSEAKSVILRDENDKLRAELVDAKSMILGLSQKATQCENDREYNAGLVAERDKELEAARSAVQDYRASEEGTRKAFTEARARIKELETTIHEQRAQDQRIIDDKCEDGEIHCPCVPALRRKIEELEAAQWWTPVSERLPEEARIVCVEFQNGETGHIFSALAYFTQVHLGGVCHIIRGLSWEVLPQKYTTIRWCYCPQPPQEEK